MFHAQTGLLIAPFALVDVASAAQTSRRPKQQAAVRPGTTFLALFDGARQAYCSRPEPLRKEARALFALHSRRCV